MELMYLNPHELRCDEHNDRADVGHGIEELVVSVKLLGILEPLRVYQSPERGNAFVISSGHRRREAAIRAGLHKVPCVVVPRPDSLLDKAVQRLVSNLLRRNLSPMEKSRAYQRLFDRYPTLTRRRLSEMLGIHESQVSNYCRLGNLPEQVQVHVDRGSLTVGHAVALLGLRALGDQEKTDRIIVKYAERVVKDGWNCRKLEKIVRDECSKVDGQVVRKGPRRKEQPPHRHANKAASEEALWFAGELGVMVEDYIYKVIASPRMRARVPAIVALLQESGELRDLVSGVSSDLVDKVLMCIDYEDRKSRLKIVS